jgi:hypothetical protein
MIPRIPWRALCAFATGSASLLLPSPGVAAEAIHLPTRADVRAASLLGPLPGHFPSKIPRRGGTVSGEELVRAGLNADGSVRDIVVTESIDIGGVGDYTLEITGPATDVERLDGSDAAPGLRNGAVIWEGFSPGTRALRARVTMDVAATRFVPLPLKFSARGGTLRIENATASLQPFGTGDADARALATAVAAARAALARGAVPEPGSTRGLAASIPVRGSAGSRAQLVSVPMRVRGTVGARRIDAVVASRPLDVPDGGAVHLTAEPVLPSASDLPPLGAAATAAARARALGALQTVLWQSALVERFSGYLGVPVAGRTHTRYEFAPAVVVARPTRAPRPAERARPVPIAIASAALLGALALGARWWARN